MFQAPACQRTCSKIFVIAPGLRLISELKPGKFAVLRIGLRRAIFSSYISQSSHRYTVGDMHNNSDQESSLGQEKSKPEVIKLKLDLHARQVTECRQLDGSTPKPAQKWIGCPGAVGQLGALSAWQPPSDERGDGAHCCARTATFGGALPRAADAQSAPSRGTRSGPGFDPGNPGPRGVVAPRSLARV